MKSSMPKPGLYSLHSFGNLPDDVRARLEEAMADIVEKLKAQEGAIRLPPGKSLSHKEHGRKLGITF